MARLILIASLVFVSTIAQLAATAAFAQNYPSKPVRIVTASVGSGQDIIVRLLSPKLSSGLGQPVIVDNRGGSANIPAEIVSKAAPDGYAILFYANGLWLLPVMETNINYDAVRDFAPIILVGSAPNVLVVHPSLPVKSVKELISLVRSKPGALDYGTGPTGTSTHLAADLFKSMAGLNMVRITYKGGGDSLIGLIGGEIQLLFPNATAVTPLMKSGKLRALAVTSSRPSPLAPGLPTVAASGVPGYESAVMYGMFAPLKTPPAVVSRLNEELSRALKQADSKEAFFSAGVDIVAGSPDQLTAAVKSEISKWSKIVKDAGIRAN